MKSPAKNINLTSYDDLFNPQSDVDTGEKIINIPLTELYPPADHPFKVLDDDAMKEMADSVEKFGVLTPGIARPLESGGYELIAGNRRKRASELAGNETMPVIVRELDDDAAVILMVDSNLQRETLLPSEKAFAYRLKLEAMKRQGMRTDLTLSPMGTKLRSDEKLAEEVGESRNQIQRYIRLTELIPDLLELVDEKQIAFRPAVELSYLTQEEQKSLYSVIDQEEVSPSMKQAQELRFYSKEGKLNEDIMIVILNQEKPLEHKITLDGKWVQSRFPKHMTPKQIRERIDKALDLLERSERQKARGMER